MPSLKKYMELRRGIIEPTLQKLVWEYNQRGYECSIDYKNRLHVPPKRRKGLLKGKDTKKKYPGLISFIRDERIVTIYYDEGQGAVILAPIERVGKRTILLDELTSELLKQTILLMLGE